MPVETVVLVVTAVLALTTVTAAVVAVRAARSAARLRAETVAAGPESTLPVPTPTASIPTPVVRTEPDPSHLVEARVVQGRVVVPPTQDQVVAAALGRPEVRAAVLARGVAHALRPESRDRIGALVRREFRRRRRERLRVGRRAARAAHAAPPRPTPASEQWLGEP